MESLRALWASWYEVSEASAEASPRREEGHHKPLLVAHVRALILQGKGTGEGSKVCVRASVWPGWGGK
jgi:hypothetical protein